MNLDSNYGIDSSIIWMNLQAAYNLNSTSDDVQDIVKIARKVAAHEKDEAVAIILNGLCDIIDTLQN